MYSFERTEDVDLIRYVIAHPKVYGRASDDFAPPREQYQPNMDPRIWYVLAKLDGLVLGLWGLFPHSDILWEVHTCLLPHAWGTVGHEASLAFLEWLWKHSPCRRLITSVPEFNRVAKRFAERAGMVEYGVNPLAYQKTKVLHNLIMLGCSRPDSNET